MAIAQQEQEINTILKQNQNQLIITINWKELGKQTMKQFHGHSVPSSLLILGLSIPQLMLETVENSLILREPCNNSYKIFDILS